MYLIARDQKAQLAQVSQGPKERGDQKDNWDPRLVECPSLRPLTFRSEFNADDLNARKF